MVDLRNKLETMWGIKAWHLIPLGKGFFSLRFDHVEDMRRVWAVGTLNLNPRLFRISQWSPNLSPFKQKLTHAQVWIRLYNLGLEYWEPQTLMEIARGVGVLIQLDRATACEFWFVC